MSLKSLNRLLRVASHLLDQAAADVRACGLEPATEQVHRIGAVAPRADGAAVEVR